ncbi:MAG: sulfotransferase [Candidatus Aminicenantaceae bacterium]
MKLKSRAFLPSHFRLLNGIGQLLKAAKLPIAQFEEDAVCKAAMKHTGLTDFGDPYYREGLLQLLDSAENDANLHAIGRFSIHYWIVNNLANRLLLTEARKRSPETFETRLIPPIIIIGLPRSGSTFLHRMLAVDPANRAIPMWELMRPLPESAAADGKPESRRKSVKLEINFRRTLAPELYSKHYISADSPEECTWMLGLTFVTLAYWIAAPVYGYLDWYIVQDRLKKYHEYRLLLQVLQSVDPAHRLTLKAPAHTDALEELLQTVPNALLIQTHRDPVTVCNSINSLYYTTHRSVTQDLDVSRMAEASMRHLESMVVRNLAARDAHPGVVYDVYYERLVDDPIGTVRGIYDHFGLNWSDSFQERLQAYVREQPRKKHGKHSYSSADFGQTDAAIAKRFAAYSERFGFTKEYARRKLQS